MNTYKTEFAKFKENNGNEYRGLRGIPRSPQNLQLLTTKNYIEKVIEKSSDFQRRFGLLTP
jgi:hypothetical protein